MKAKLDTHVHTCEVSSCGVLSAREVVEAYIDADYDGIIITDHLINSQAFALDIAPEELLERQLRGYHIARERAGSKLTVLPGAEIRFTSGVEDFLIIGLDEAGLLELMRARPDSPGECLRVVELLGGLLYQAHPYRPKHAAAAPESLHGVEVYNGNPRHDSHNDRARAFAAQNGLRMLSGSDAHRAEDVAHGGILLPRDAIETPRTLVEYLDATFIPELIEMELPQIGG